MTSNYDQYSIQREKVPVPGKPAYKEVKTTILPAVGPTNASSGLCQFHYKSTADDFVDWSANSTGVQFQVVHSAVTTAANTNPFSIGPKPAGVLGYIDKVGIRVNDITVSVGQRYLNVYRYLKYLFATSLNTHKLLGPALKMGSELPEEELRAWFYGGAAVNTASAYSCSSVRPGPDLIPLFSSMRSASYNRALYSRCIDNVYPSTSSAFVNGSVGGRGTFASTSTSQTWTSNYFVPLCILHDFFDKAGVLKGVSVKLDVYFNNVSGLAAMPAGTNAFPGSGAIVSAGAMSNQQCPFMLTDAAILSAGPTSGVVGDGATLAQSTVVQASMVSAASTHSSASVQCGVAQPPNMYLTNVILNAEEELQWSSAPKTIRYLDHITSEVSTVGATSAIQWTLTTSARGAQKVFVLGFPTANGTGSSGKLAALPAAADPSVPEPYYSSPLFALTNMEWRIGGTSLGVPIDYQFRDFMQNTMPFTEINGGQTLELSCGLYSSRAWDISKIYTFDISRYALGKNEASIELRANNASACSTDLIAYIEQLNEITIKQRPGVASEVSPITIGPV